MMPNDKNRSDRNRFDQGEAVAAAAARRQTARKQYASHLEEAAQEAAYRPRLVSEETYAAVLDDVANGELLYLACRRHGVSHGLFYNRARVDDAFAERLRQARIDMVLTRLDHTFLIAAGVEGFSTGDVARDSLLVKVTQNAGKAFAPQFFAERVQHDVAHSIAPVMLPPADLFAPPALCEGPAGDDPATG